MREMWRLFVIAALAGGFLSALVLPASAQTGCNHIKDTFAYNECLAKQAPPRAQRVRGSSRAGDPEATVRGRTADPDAGLAARGLQIDRRSRGRVRAVIDPWAGSRTPTTSARKKRR